MVASDSLNPESFVMVSDKCVIDYSGIFTEFMTFQNNHSKFISSVPKIKHKPAVNFGMVMEAIL